MRSNKLFILILVILCLVKMDIVHAENIYKEYKIGDKITYRDMEFYVIENSDSAKDYVTLLKATPLTVDEVNTYGIDSNGINHVNRYTDEFVGTAYNSNGYGGVAYYTSETCRDANSSQVIREGCTADYTKSEVKYIVDTWSKTKLDTKDLKEDSLGYKVRLITYDELLSNLGFENNFYCKAYCSYTGSIENVPSWLFGDYWYWTMSPEYDRSAYAWFLVENGLGSEYSNYTVYNYKATIRPVINLKKDPIGQKKKLTDKEFKIGDVIEYNNMLFYVIKDSTEKDASVTLLKAEPLSVDEVNKYGGVGTDNNHVNMHIDPKLKYYQTAANFNGYGGMAYYTSETCGYDSTTTSYDNCTTDYDESEVKYVIDVWAKNKLNASDLTEDSLGYKTRLLTYDDLINNLGYDSENMSTPYLPPSVLTPLWLYNSFYWTMVQYGDSNYLVRRVLMGGQLGAFGVIDVSMVRPVVTLKKITEDKSENIEIEKEENDDIKNEVTEDKKTNQIISVPDTLLKKPFIFVVLGVILIAISTTIYILIRRKNDNKKK